MEAGHYSPAELRALARNVDQQLTSFQVGNTWPLQVLSDGLPVFSHLNFQPNESVSSGERVELEVTGLYEPNEEQVRRVAVIGSDLTAILSYRKDANTNAITYAHVAEYDGQRHLEVNMDAVLAQSVEDTEGNHGYLRRPASTFKSLYDIALSRNRNATQVA